MGTNLIFTYDNYLSSLVAFHRLMMVIEAYKLTEMASIVPDIGDGFVLTVVTDTEGLMEMMYRQFEAAAYISE